MASASFQSSHLELWGQSEIKKPEPLRIVKERANTITGCGTPRTAPMPRRGSFGHPNTRGSSPEGPSRSLTIFKRRRARGSVLDGSLEWNSGASFTSSEVSEISEPHKIFLKNEHGPPKVRQSSTRTSSLGSFLRSELFRGSSESESNISCPHSVRVYPRNLKDTSNPLNMEHFPPFNLCDLETNQELSFTPTQRRKSIGKSLVSKAFDGIGNARPKSMHFLRSKSSEDSLLRKISLRNLEPSPQISSEMSSRNFSRFSFEQESVLIRDSRSGSLRRAEEVPLVPSISFILYPEITVIPEIDTVDFGVEISLWVAVVVTGVLRKTTDYDQIADTPLTSQTSCISQDNATSDRNSYGYLYGVDITLAAREGCILERVITEKYQPRRLHLGQSDIILAKVKLVGRRSSLNVRKSSKELIAELESQLGNATTEYLTIGISYKNSVFPTSRSSITTTTGLSFHTTTARIEAHAVIKRHCWESSWSRQASESRDFNGLSNPLFSLITAHCSPVKAARLISKIANDPISTAAKHGEDSDTSRLWNSSSDTITPIRRKTSKNTPSHASQHENPVSITASKQSLDITQAGFHDRDWSSNTPALNPCSDPDPARKIWLDMRKTSRGTGKRHSQVHESLDIDVEGRSSGRQEAEINVQREQARIMELALRNKRSIGADTLRSMATPSMSMGLGLGRGWGWGPPWW